QVRLQTQYKYHGIIDCIKKTYKNERVHGFFKGMSFPVFTVAVSNSVAFGTYGNTLDYLSQSYPSNSNFPPSFTDAFLAGCFAGATQLLVSAPVDLVKVRLQNQTHPHQSVHTACVTSKYRGPVHCAATILQQEGIQGLYRGLGALALRDIPCFGLYFLPYELICYGMTEAGQQPGTLAVLVAGGCAGVITWACATPMDVIKARLQMDGLEGCRYRGILHCVTDSIRTEGFSVLFRGLLLNSVRAFPVNAVTFLSYETLLEIIK
ncbi:S2545 protein, partial [Polypterus senegalus]